MSEKKGKNEHKNSENSQRPKFIIWFSELNKNSGSVGGGKGANLGEMYNHGFPVPPGFVVTAQAYSYFIKKADLDSQIKEIIDETDVENTAELNTNTERIRGLIVNAKMPKEMEDEIIEAYDSLDINKEALKTATGTALDILKRSSEPVFVAVRSSATTEDLATASFAGQQDTYLNVKGNTNLITHVKRCFASLFTARATYYRKKRGFTLDQAQLAVVVQRMIDSDKSGVIFSKDPTSREENKDNIIIEAVFGLGEGIVSGAIKPDQYIVTRNAEIVKTHVADKKIAITRNSAGDEETVKLNSGLSKAQVLKNHEIKQLAIHAMKLEEHYNKPQDIEFAIEKGEIYIVQTRAITTIGKETKGQRELKGEILLSGMPASPGIASGTVRIIHDLRELEKVKKGDILVTTMTNPDMVVSMAKSSAIVTDEGGLTSHAAIVSREMGIPAVVGTEEATTKLVDGQIITVDGFTGDIFDGKVSEDVKKEILPVVKTKIKIKVIVDLPSAAERASLSKASSVGLMRLEGVIAESGKHPNYFIKKKNMKEYEEIIYKGISGIAEYFEELWVRTSDIRTDEYKNLEGAPQEPEGNPMLGMHGIRYSLKHPEILEAEIKAMKRVAEQGKTIGILTPQVVTLEELKKTKEYIKNLNAGILKLGVMIETPAAVQIIEELCQQGIKFISFGTNDLTQYTMAIDRNNEEVQYLHDESNPAVIRQLKYVIEVCKKHNVETSICGQAGSKKEIAKILVEAGISSITVNADAAHEISEYVAELESKEGKDADEEENEEDEEYEEDSENGDGEDNNNDNEENNESEDSLLPPPPVDEEIDFEEKFLKETNSEDEEGKDADEEESEEGEEGEENANQIEFVENEELNKELEQLEEDIKEGIEEEDTRENEEIKGEILPDEETDENDDEEDIQDPSIEKGDEDDEDEKLDIF